MTPEMDWRPIFVAHFCWWIQLSSAASHSRRTTLGLNKLERFLIPSSASSPSSSSSSSSSSSPSSSSSSSSSSSTQSMKSMPTLGRDSDWEQNINKSGSQLNRSDSDDGHPTGTDDQEKARNMKIQHLQVIKAIVLIVIVVVLILSTCKILFGQTLKYQVETASMEELEHWT